MSTTATGSVVTALPLFPLQAVLFPGGLLNLRVFEARYLDLMSHCLREPSPFGVVCLAQGSELRARSRSAEAGAVRLEPIGVLAHLQQVDAEQPGILHVRCIGAERFALAATTQRGDGLWLADVELLPADEPAAVPPELAPTRAALANAIESLQGQGHQPFAEPFDLDDAGWVANRWCELLPIPLPAKQRLMALDEPALRLQLVDEFLRTKGVIQRA